jgi:hypothetical protein
MQICKYCDQEVNHLIKAHIIPRSFFGLVRKEAKYAVTFQASAEGVRTEYKQAGIYDESILCERCEQQFTTWDNHGFAVLSTERTDKDVYRDPAGYECGVVVPDLEYDVFKLFLLSVLWRASVSSDKFFRKVQLGPHENRIRAYLKAREAPTTQEYAAILILPFGQPFPNVMLTPFRSRVKDVWFYRLYFPNVIALIKVDQRATPPPFDKICIRPDGDNYLVFQPHKGTAEDAFYRNLHAFMKENNLFEEQNGRS